MSDSTDAPTIRQVASPDVLAQQGALARAKRALLGVGDAGPGDTPDEPVTVGRYQLQGLLGAGGMGHVYRAHDPQLERDVAIKLINPAAFDGAEDRREGEQRLIREARAIAALSHPNVVAVHDVGTYRHGTEQAVYLVMELIEGVELGAWLEQHPRSWREVVDVFIDAGNGLAAAHRADVIHRDFKPHNVLVDSVGRARVVDFGIALTQSTRGAAAQPLLAFPDDIEELRTLPGTVLGTPAYMAPEQHQAEGSDALSDQYGFCVALFQALYGRLPFEGRTRDELAVRKLEGELRFDGGPRLPASLRALLARGLRPDPRERFADLDTLLDRLRSIRARRARIAYATTGLGVVLAFTLWSTLGSRSPDCEADAAQRMNRLWNDGIRASLRAGFHAADPEGAEDAWSRTERAVQHAADTWTTGTRELCEREADGPDARTVAALASERACLDREYVRMAEFLQTLAGPLEADWIGQAPQGALALGPWRCAQSDGLARRSTEDALARERELLRAQALVDSGRSEEALPLAEAVIERAEAADDLELEARAEHLAGRIAAFRREHERAVQHFYRAIIVAERGGHVVPAFMAHARVMTTLSFAGRPDEARRAAEQCERLLEDAEIPDHAAARYRYNLAIFELNTTGTQRALEILDRAEPQLLEAYGPKSFWAAQIHNLRGSALRRAGRADEAVEELVRANDVLVVSVGEQSPVAVGYRLNLATALIDAERADDAMPQIDRAWQLLEAKGHDQSTTAASVLLARGRALEDLGRVDEAITATERSLRLREQHGVSGTAEARERLVRLRSQPL